MKLDEDTVSRHAALLAQMPPGAHHDPTSCPVCASAEGAVLEPSEETTTMTTITQEQHEAQVAAAVTEATAALEARVNELTAQLAGDETAQAVAAAVAPLEAQVAELNTRNDALAAELAAEREARAGELAYLQSVDEDNREQAAFAERRTERLAQVAEVSSFTEEQLEERGDRWAGMEQAAFDDVLAELREVAARAGSTFVPRPSSLLARETAAATGTSAVANALALRGTKYDPRRTGIDAG